MDKKSVFTTGEIAKLIHMHQTTVIDWVDKGLITSYKTPGGHRRISRESLLNFLKDHNIPMPKALTPSAPTQGETEKHRHLHESFQVNPYSQSKPMKAFPPLQKTGASRNVQKSTRVAQKTK